MKKLNLERHPEFIRGGDASFSRMNFELKEFYGVNEKSRLRAECATGIRIVLCTDAGELEFQLAFGLAAREIFTTDAITENGTLTFDGSGPHRLFFSEGRQEVTLHLPHLAKVREFELRIPENAFVLPAPLPEKRILFCGDSIIQGMVCTSPAKSLAALTAAALRSDFRNTAVGGARMSPEPVKGTLRFGGDFIVAAFGVNDAILKTPYSEFETNTRRVFSILAENSIPALFVAPIPNLASTTPELDNYRSIIFKVAEEFPGVSVEDGYRFFPPDPTLFHDGTHPNDTGMKVYAQHIINHIRKEMS